MLRISSVSLVLTAFAGSACHEVPNEGARAIQEEDVSPFGLPPGLPSSSPTDSVRCDPHYEYEVASRPPLDRPDSLLRPTWHGRVVYQFRLEPDGRQRHVGIRRLDINDEAGASVVAFAGPVIEAYPSHYPPAVLPFVPWLMRHAEKYRFRYRCDSSRVPITDGIFVQANF